MKALIVSDSHGATEELQLLRQRYEGIVDVMLHCGDSELPEDHPALQGFQVVNGNRDLYGSTFQEEYLNEIKGTTIYMVHGHWHGIKYSFKKVANRAKELNATIVCFGHSHVREASMVDQVLCINPGSFRFPKRYLEKSYVILTCDEHTNIVRFYDEKHKEINKFEISK
ncbi:metallophosphoesterase family protein [Enterococcus mundtii]|uniref:Phosphoesterase n=1 Tax=Enterococcus mundtii TaxID=53346 RepID=A0A2S7RWD1_ENTMU|nr:metallophosphoesterase [Enterococcus mundtii]MDA9462639.1 phosphoesterase [Enterococcus mundtii 3F]PQF24254.1 YfcE family phosphodiesterase [Enterococcus mundtii]